ncbi:PREDICTED: cadherin-23-like [Acropora digitifera]|uniref:cadherin-23-like n=1 Tax=Acropora digitifera TaxID=70779 RepID=UPI00077A0044|nr:PREDICTED: cadherin-23-like [Acropora digitifera]
MPNTSSTHVGVYVTRSLDRELVSEYQFLVKATNLDEHAQESTTVVRVIVNDINDNAPHFKKKIYDVSILENATLGQLVFVLEAVDDDALFNANISYKLMGGSGMNTFSLDQTSGEIKLTKLLDRETKPSYSLFVAAYDSDFTAFTEVSVTLIDVNDNPPTFEPAVHKLSINLRADSPVSSAVITLNAVDHDLGVSGKISYSVEAISTTPVFDHINALECANASPGTFKFDDDTGTLRVAELLAAMCRYNVTVRAMDHGNPPLFSLTSVVIETGERNAVELKGPTGINVVSEEASVELNPGTFVSVHVYSDDKDRWLVSSQSSKSILSLNPITPSSVIQGFLARLSTNVSVGRRQSSDWFRLENWTTYERSGYFKTITGLFSNGVLVVGSAGVYIISVNLILQCTENSACDFEMLVAFNGRLSPKSGLFSRQTVHSLHSETFTASTVAHLFQWDSLVVAVRSNSSSQILSDSTFSVVMLESIGGPLLCSNLGPSFIQELSPAFLRSRVGSEVTWSCEAVGGTSLKYRWLKNYQVLPNATLNTLTVNRASVQDSGDYVCIAEISPITVTSNVARFTAYDPQPAFESFNYTLYVNENGPTSQLILNISVKAESKGNTRADMAFSIMLGNTDDPFFLMPNTSSTHVGVFVTRSLDRELVSEYQFLVKATNLDEHAQESTTVVRVIVNDINDNAPHFKKKIYDVSILENATLGQLVFVLEAVDDDALFNANISYKLMGGSGMNTFSLDQTSGEIKLTKLLDRETKPSYSLFVAAYDSDFTAFTEVSVTLIDVNDNPPTFEPAVHQVTNGRQRRQQAKETSV